MAEAGKWMVLAGCGLALFGGLLWGLARLGFKGLPGDIRVEGDSFRFYFPIVSCILLSLVLTLGMALVQWLNGRR